MVTYNQHSGRTSSHLWGGTAILSWDKLSPYACGIEEDPSGLGRWTSARFQGRNGVFLRVVSAYRPVSHSANDGSGELTLHAQHLKYLNEWNDNQSPRLAFMEDLEEASPNGS